MSTKTVSIGPFRIPKEYKDGLNRLKAGKAYITYSDLVREAIYLFLKEKGIIEDEKAIT
jgi:Arc/MetJ-type ribon-helix-helix transcriptional regulator